MIANDTIFGSELRGRMNFLEIIELYYHVRSEQWQCNNIFCILSDNSNIYNNYLPFNIY